MLVLGHKAGAQSAQSDTFSQVSSIDQINGAWKGSSSSSQTMKQFLEGQGSGWTSDIQQAFGDMSVKINLDLNMNVNAKTRNGDITVKATFAFSGGNINSAWAALRDGLTSDESATANDANHSITYSLSVSEPMTDEDLDGFQINQNGTKMRFSLADMGVNFLTDYLELIKQ